MKTNKLSALVLVTGLMVGAQALAHEFEVGRGLAARSAPGEEVSGDGAGKSTTNAEVSTSRSLKATTLSASPQAGVIGYTNGSGDYVARGAAGLIVDGNIGKLFIDEAGLLGNFYVGVSSGAVYSHLGTSSASNFFGKSSDDAGNTQADLLVIPTDIKVGFHLSDSARVSVHGGGNLIYSSAAGAVNFSQGTWDEGARWNYFPNAGADLEVSLGHNVSLVARPDVTFFTTGETLFTGTLGLNVSML